MDSGGRYCVDLPDDMIEGGLNHAGLYQRSGDLQAPNAPDAHIQLALSGEPSQLSLQTVPCREEKCNIFAHREIRGCR